MFNERASVSETLRRFLKLGQNINYSYFKMKLSYINTLSRPLTFQLNIFFDRLILNRINGIWISIPNFRHRPNFLRNRPFSDGRHKRRLAVTAALGTTAGRKKTYTRMNWNANTKNGLYRVTLVTDNARLPLMLCDFFNGVRLMYYSRTLEQMSPVWNYSNDDIHIP